MTHSSPENETTEGYTEAEGYAASLREQADLMEKANAGKVSAYVAIDDFDVDELRDAADFIERISAQQMRDRPEAEYVKAICKHLRSGHPYSGVIDKNDVAAADLIEALYLAALPSSSSPECTHPNAKVWMYRDDDTWMICPNCNSKWCGEPITSPEYESKAKATEGKAGMAGGDHAPLRRSTAGTGLRVGEASADLPATSEHMDVTARRDGTLIRPQQMREALERMVYEVTHLSPREDDGSHKCKISAEALAKARAALSHTRPECGDAT